MPINAYDDVRIGARSFTRTLRVKLMVLAVFVASMTAVPLLVWLFT